MNKEFEAIVKKLKASKYGGLVLIVEKTKNKGEYSGDYFSSQVDPLEAGMILKRSAEKTIIEGIKDELGKAINNLKKKTKKKAPVSKKKVVTKKK